jgi:hypothetical protein
MTCTENAWPAVTVVGGSWTKSRDWARSVEGMPTIERVAVARRGRNREENRSV